MRNMLLVTVSLLLAVTELNGEYSFGDIISFERNCPCIKPLTYKHFAIYVGDREMEGKDPDKDKDKDIYQRTGPVTSIDPPKVSDCIFDKLEKEQKPSTWTKNIERKDNYLDRFDNFTVGPEEKIIERINETKGNCGRYKLRANNCEHLATYVRYGVRVSLQLDTFGEKHCKNNHEICPLLKDIMASLKNEAKCQTCSEPSSSHD